MFDERSPGKSPLKVVGRVRRQATPRTGQWRDYATPEIEAGLEAGFGRALELAGYGREG